MLKVQKGALDESTFFLCAYVLYGASEKEDVHAVVT